MQIKISLTGLEQAQLELAMLDKTHEQKVRKIVKHHGAELTRGMKRNANFHGHVENGRFVPPTGATKRSISLDIVRGGFGAKVGPHTDYSMYLEYGTRYMAAQPFVGVSLEEQGPKFLEDLRTVLE